MKNFSITLLLCLSGLIARSQVYPAQNFTMVSNISPETAVNSDGVKYSGCWGWYQTSTNKEYAIAASQSGTYWVDVTNPATPTVCAYRVGAHNGATWREVKTYQNYCYVISDDWGINRLQIFDMQYLPDSVHKVHDSQSIFKQGHAHWIDGNKWYVASVTYSNSTFSSMDVYSLATPSVPVLLRSLDQDYPSLVNHVHDMFVRNDTVYASCGYDGLYVFKFTALNTFSLISSLTAYPFSGYNHSSALTPDGQTLVFLDEVPAGLPIKVADVSNLSNIQVLQTINQYSNTTPHNPFIVSNQYCFVSAYQDGLQLFDISNPSSPFLAGYFDTYPQAGGNNNSWPNGGTYKGQWGAYPFFPSKNIFALDRLNGLFMLSSHLYQNPAPSPTVGFTAPSLVCVGASVTLSNTTLGAGTYTWTFQGGTPATSTLSNPTVVYNSTGSFNILLSASNGTTQSSSNWVIQIKQVSAVTSHTHASCGTCPNGSAKVTASGGIAPYTYTWLPSGGNASLAVNLVPACYTVQVKDSINCSSSKTLCISHTTGLEEMEPTKLLSLYPNPAKTSLEIQTSFSEFNYSLIDGLGQILLSGHASGKQATNLDVSVLPRGFYVVECRFGEKILRKKVLLN